MAADIKRIMQSNKVIKGNNDNMRSYYQDVADFCLTRKAWITSEKTSGERLKFRYLYNTQANRRIRTAAAGFHSNLTNPSSKWFMLAPRNQELAGKTHIKKFFHSLSDKVYSILGDTNFDETIHEFYVDELTFGTASVLSLADKKKFIRFQGIPVQEINLEEDAYGRITAMYRNFKLSAMKAYMLWGNNAGKTVKDIIDEFEKNGNSSKVFDENIEFLHYVGPRSRRDFTKNDSLNMPYESVWIAIKDNHKISESGFEEFPYHTARFYKQTGDTMGSSPSMETLPEIKLLNVAYRTWMRRAQKEADPPLKMPKTGYLMPFNLNPGAANLYDKDKANVDDVQAIAFNSNFSITDKFIQKIEESIDDAYFIRLFRTLSEITKQMTIPEIQRRIAEGMIELGPVVGRFTTEFFDNLIIRLIMMLYRSKEIGEIPEELYGEDFDVIYLGPLAKAQRQDELYTIDSFLGRVASMAQFKPEVIDKIDEDATVDIISDISGINPNVLRDNTTVEEIRAARAQQAQAAAQMEMLDRGANIVKTGAQANKDLEAVKQ